MQVIDTIFGIFFNFGLVNSYLSKKDGVFGDYTLANAIIEYLVHHSNIIRGQKSNVGF